MNEPTTAEVLRSGAAMALLMVCGIFVSPLEAIILYSAANPPFATGAFQLALIVLPGAGLPAWFLCPRNSRTLLFSKAIIYSTSFSLFVLLLLCSRIVVSYSAVVISFIVLLIQFAVGIAFAMRAKRP